MAGKKNRQELQNLFRTGAKPSEQDFQDLFDSVLNSTDDGIEKPPGTDTPLKIVAWGESENLLDFYADEVHTWRLSQKPGETTGLNLETGGISRLFLESQSGNLGIGTIAPTARLHVRQSGDRDALRVDDEETDATPLVVDASGNVGIGKADPAAQLDVSGEVAIAGPLSVRGKTTLSGNVGIGAAPGSEKLKVTGNAAIAGALEVSQGVAIAGSLQIGKGVAIAESLQVGQGATITGPLQANQDAAIAESLQVYKSATIAESLQVGLGAAIAGSLSVDAKTTLTGNVGIGAAPGSETLKVNGDTAIAGSLSVKNANLKVFDSELVLQVANNINEQSLLFQNSGGAYTWRIYRQDAGNNLANLKIAGGANPDSSQLADYITIGASGDTAIAGSLSVGATTTLTGNVGIGTAPGSETLKVGGNTAIASSLSVDATTTLTGNVGIGTASGSETLKVGGDAAIAGSLSVKNAELKVFDSELILQVADNANEQSILFQNSGGAYTWRIYRQNAGNSRTNLKIACGLNTDPTVLADYIAIDSNGRTTTKELAIDGPLALLGASFDTGTALMSGAANDYLKAQFALSGGGTVTWEGPDGRLNWTKRFIAISMGGDRALFSDRHIDIDPPSSDIPAENVYDGQARSVDANGVLLKKWEALYAIHAVGGKRDDVRLQIVHYQTTFRAPSNWILIGVVNADNNSIKLGTGTIVAKRSSSTHGSPIPKGTIVMWFGAANAIPAGWAACNGRNGTPDLRDRFVVGAGNAYEVGTRGGQNEVTLSLNQIPAHDHAGNTYKYLLKVDGHDTVKKSDGDGNQPNLKYRGEIQTQGGGQAHENRPPFHALLYIMKL